MQMKRSVLVAMMLCGSILFGCGNGVTQEALDFVDYAESLGNSNNANSSFGIISDVHKYEHGGSLCVVFDIVGFNEKATKDLWDAIKVWKEAKDLKMVYVVRTLDQDGNVVGYANYLGGIYYDDEEHLEELEHNMNNVWKPID